MEILAEVWSSKAVPHPVAALGLGGEQGRKGKGQAGAAAVDVGEGLVRAAQACQQVVQPLARDLLHCGVRLAEQPALEGSPYL